MRTNTNSNANSTHMILTGCLPSQFGARAQSSIKKLNKAVKYADVITVNIKQTAEIGT